MPNIQFEQEQYGSSFLHEDAARPWFIRILFKLGITQSETVANVLSVIIAIILITFSTMFYLSNRTEPELPPHFQNLPSYEQDIYTTFYE